MAKVTENTIDISVPFALPFLGLHEPTTISIDKAMLQLAVRFVVVICAAILFWPKIRMAFGFGVGRDSEAEQKEIQERIAKLEHERGQSLNKKNAAIVTGNTNSPATPAQADQKKVNGSVKRRKA